jgi:hypothetical protein
MSVPMPFAGRPGEAPVFKDLPEADKNLQERFAHVNGIGLNSELGGRSRERK